MKRFCLWSMIILMFMLTKVLERKQIKVKAHHSAQRKASIKAKVKGNKMNLFPHVFELLLKKLIILQNLILCQHLW